MPASFIAGFIVSIKRSAFAIVVAIVLGCGSKPPAGPSLAESSAQKIAAMQKIAEAATAPNPEFAVRHALEQFRKIPFQAKEQMDAAKEIIRIYTEQVRPKLGGEIAAEVAGDVEIIANEMK